MFSTLSDSALSAFRLWVSWIAVSGGGIGVACGVLTIFSTREANQRSEKKASAVEESLKGQLLQAEQQTQEAQRLASEARAASLPRTLTQEQGAALAAVITESPKGKIIVKANMLDTEAEQYSLSISHVLMAAGAKVIEQGYTGIVSLREPGVSLIVKNPKAVPDHASEIIRAFGMANIPLRLINAPSAELAEDTVIIWVSRK